MNAKQGELFLVPFPFSNFKGSKVRPVLVLSKDSYNIHSSDVIVCAITSQIQQNAYSIEIGNDNLAEGILYERSAVKIENILKIEKSLFIKKIATVNSRTISQIIAIAQSLFK